MYKHILFFLILFWGTFSFAQQGPGTGSNTNALDIQISTPQDAHICGVSTITLTISNTNNINCIKLNDLELDLDPGVQDYVTLEALGSNSVPGVFIISGGGSSNPMLGFSQPLLPQTSAQVILQVRYDCALFNIRDQLPVFSVKSTAHWDLIHCGTQQIVAGGQVLQLQSESYPVTYSFVSPSLNLQGISAAPGTPFSLSIPLEVSGAFCDADFFVRFTGFGQCFDFSDATYGFGGTEQPFPAAQGDEIWLPVQAQTFGLASFCTQNYPGGMGELTLQLKNLRLNCTGCLPTTTIDLGFSTCSPGAQSADCFNAAGYPNPQIQTSTTVKTLTPKVAQVELVNVAETDPFKVCYGQNKLIFRVGNRSTDVSAYDLRLCLEVMDGYDIANIKISDMDWPFTLSNGQVLLSFSQNTNPGIGLSDVNDDGFYAEISPLTGFMVEVIYTKRPPSCPFGSGEACKGNCSSISKDKISVVKAEASWNNICNSLSPAARTALNYTVQFNGYRMNLKYDDSKILLGEQRQFNANLGTGSVTGFNGYLENGPIRQYVCLSTNLPPDKLDQVKFYNISYGNVSYSGPFSGGTLDIGPADMGQLGGGNLSFEIAFLYCDQTTPRVLEINIETGFYFENCPDCFFPMACDKAKLIPPCYNNLNLEACDVLAPNFSLINEVYLGTGIQPEIAKAYPCDRLIATLNSTPVLQTQTGPLIIGFAAERELLEDYLVNSNSFQGSIFQTHPMAGTVELNFTGPYEVDAGPMTLIYFRSDENPLTEGYSINGQFNIQMSDDFEKYFEKIEFFHLFVGYINDGTNFFCMENHTLHALDVDYSLRNNLETDCKEGSRIQVDLIKIGGEVKGYGPDFPGIYRPAIWFGSQRINNTNPPLPSGNIIANVDEANPDHEVTYIGEDPNGMAASPDNPYSIEARTLPQPTGLEEEGDVVQTLYVKYQDNCAGNIPAKIDLDVTRRPDTQGSCPLTTHSTLLSTDMPHTTAALPDIQATFLPENQSSVVFVDLNRVSVRTRTTNTATVAADFAWIQLSYDPAKLKLVDIQDEGDDFEAPEQLDCNGENRTIIWIKYKNLGAGVSKENQFDFILTEASCTMPVDLRLEGYHTCFPFDAALPACPANDPEHCADSHDDLRLIPLGSTLGLSARRCNQALDICEKVYVSVLLDNLSGQGSTDQVRIALELPPGLSLTNASFREEFTPHCTAVTEIADINALTSTGWDIPSTFLPGIQSGKIDAQRYFYLYLELEVGCDRDPEFNSINIHARGVTPCGTELQRTVTVKDLFRVPDYSNVSVNLNAFVLEYDCATDQGTMGLQIQQLLNWPGGTGTITLRSPQNVIFTPNVIEFTQNGPLYFPITVTNPNISCYFELIADIEYCKAYYCEGPYYPSCISCTNIGQYRYQYPEAEGSLFISQEVCLAEPEGTTTMIAKVPYPSSLIGQGYDISVFCDQNGNRIHDAGETMLITQATGFFSGANPQGYYAVYIPIKNDLLLSCDGEIVVSFNNECICLAPVSTTFCCQCPEWQYTRTVMEGTVTIDPQPSSTGTQPDCVEVYVDGTFKDYYFSYPFSFELDGGEDVCLIFRKNVPKTCVDDVCPFREGCDATCCTEDCFNVSRIGERNEVAEQAEFNAWVQPNPFQDYFELQVNGLTKGVPWQLEIMNATGAVIWYQQQPLPTEGSASVPVRMDDLPAGLYFLKISSEVKSQVLKLAKQ